MSTLFGVTSEALAKLKYIIEVNKSVDWRAFSFENPNQLQALRWSESEDKQEQLVSLLKAYQRLVRILPANEEHRALPLLRAGLHSAIQIANLSRHEFARSWSALFPGEDALGAAVHQRALARRSTLALHHLDELQHNEPHYRAARFR